MIKVFVVKHVPSGKFLPPVRAYHSTTAREPSDTPRIFYRRQDAKSAAEWWAKGRAGTEYDWGEEGREAIGVVSEPVKGRLLHDLRVCTAQLYIDKAGEKLT